MRNSLCPLRFTWLAATAVLAASLVACSDGSAVSSAPRVTAHKVDASTVGPVTGGTPSASSRGTTVHIQLQRSINAMNAPTCLDTMCVYSFGNSPIHVSGDFSGVAVSAGAGAPLLGGGFGGTGYSVFTGTAAACGSGTGSVAWIDRVTQGVDGKDKSTWEIVDGSGTGALAHLRGRGAGIADRTSVAANGSGRSEAEGTVTCG